MKTILLMSTLVLAVSSFGGSEDKFLKKYAMMKIYESCFGPEVVKQIRGEMKEACAKCAALEAPPTPQPPPEDALPNAAQQPNFDIEKLHQAILAFRPNPPNPQFYRPYTPNFYNPQQFSNPAYSNPMMYPAANPYGAFPVFGQPYYGNRVARGMDLSSQLEALTSRMSGKVRNITCVMQELGYLNERLEPNFQKINERIVNLPVSEELKRDMQEGVSFCQQFSQCVPDVKTDRSPLSKELIRPMFFFKCYKHKKLEACIMKDVREKYTGVTDEELEGDVELRRTAKSVDLETPEHVDGLASSLYDFLYGAESNLDIDGAL